MNEQSELLASKSSVALLIFQKSLQPLACLFTLSAFGVVLFMPKIAAKTPKEEPSNAFIIFASLSLVAMTVCLLTAYFSPYNEGWAWKNDSTEDANARYGVFEDGEPIKGDYQFESSTTSSSGSSDKQSSDDYGVATLSLNWDPEDPESDSSSDAIALLTF